MMQTLSVEAVSVATDDVRRLIDELDRALSVDYGPDQRHGLTVNALFQPHVRFFIARLDGVAVGCGGVALFAAFGEVKRMYVREIARGRGVARALLSRIESEARSCGRNVLRLETGDRQLAAIRLYQSVGYRRCDVFGDYSSMAPHSIATSLFFEKLLDSGKSTTDDARSRQADCDDARRS